MKKLIYLFLTVLIVACSGDDDSNSGVTLNAQFVGSWLTEFDDEEGGTLLLTFNTDGTGNDTETYDGDTYTEVFTWSTTSTLMTVTYADPNDPDQPDDVDELMYEFLTDDQVKFTVEDQIAIIYDRVID